MNKQNNQYHSIDIMFDTNPIIKTLKILCSCISIWYGSSLVWYR